MPETWQWIYRPNSFILQMDKLRPVRGPRAAQVTVYYVEELGFPKFTWFRNLTAALLPLPVTRFTFELRVSPSCELVKTTGRASREISAGSWLSCDPNRPQSKRADDAQRGVPQAGSPPKPPTRGPHPSFPLSCFRGVPRPSACSLGRRMSWFTLAAVLGW